MMEIQEKIADYFDDFNAAFVTFDGHRVASKFSFPLIARNSVGVSKVFSHPSELAAYFQDYLNEYRARGCVRCQYDELQVTMLGDAVALASVRWSLLDNALATVLSWQESYLLSVVSGEATAFATIDHA